MNYGHGMEKSNVALNPIIVKEVARAYGDGDKAIKRVLRRYGVVPSMVSEYCTEAEKVYEAMYK